MGTVPGDIVSPGRTLAPNLTLASLHLSPVTVAIGVALYLMVLLGPTPPIRFLRAPRFVGATLGLAYVSALFGVAFGGFFLAVTGSAKAAAIGGAAAGVLFAIFMGLVSSGAAVVIRRLRPETWQFARAWSEAGFWSVDSWWNLRRIRQTRRQTRLFIALRHEWMTLATPRPSAGQFLEARRPSIDGRLSR